MTSISFRFYSDGTLYGIRFGNIYGTHRLDGPATQSFHENGSLNFQYFCINGKCHRIDGPAHQTFLSNGAIFMQTYIINGKCHRIDGPSVQQFYPDGQINYQAYSINNKYHRLNGPAKQTFDELGISYNKEYYINHIQISYTHLLSLKLKFLILIKNFIHTLHVHKKQKARAEHIVMQEHFFNPDNKNGEFEKIQKNFKQLIMDEIPKIHRDKFQVRPIIDVNIVSTPPEPRSNNRKTGGFAILYELPSNNNELDEAVFVMFQAKKESRAGKLEFPGGKKEDCDNDIYDQISRELREETCEYLNITAGDLKHTHGFSPNKGASYFVMINVPNMSDQHFQHNIKVECETTNREHYQELNKIVKIPFSEIPIKKYIKKDIHVTSVDGKRYTIWSLSALAALVFMKYHYLKNKS